MDLNEAKHVGKDQKEKQILSEEINENENIYLKLGSSKISKVHFRGAGKALYLWSGNKYFTDNLKYYKNKEQISSEIQAQHGYGMPKHFKAYEISRACLQNAFYSNSEMFAFLDNPRQVQIGNEFNGFLNLNEKFYKMLVYKTLSMCLESINISKLILTKRDISKILICGRHLQATNFNSCIIPSQKYPQNFNNYVTQTNLKVVNFIDCASSEGSDIGSCKKMICSIMKGILNTELVNLMECVTFTGAPLEIKAQELGEELGSKGVKGCWKYDQRLIYFDLGPS
ncbi:unnamed protein product [Moneuplotes crassus]|uniref:Uncharacterized protein n=1 Tax=Euplotes crassus TaxID=5936 RepID=A0AAD1XJ85_EUPCR|nr:unnamed protein product [Moneuplotes crassus]